MPYSDRAKVYRVEYVEERDYAFVDDLLGDRQLRVLEVPCGAGRLSGRLARKAAELTLVDIEPAMVAKAAVAASCANGSVRVRAEARDMRMLDLGCCFDVALVPREALQLLSPDDGKQAISAIGTHVAEGGILFVDVATFSAKKRTLADPDYFDPDRPDDSWREDWTRDLPDGSTLTRHSTQHQEAASILIRLAYQIEHPLGARESWCSEMRLHRYERGWFDLAVPDGMELEAVYGDYDRSPFSDESPRLLAIYRKSTSHS